MVENILNHIWMCKFGICYFFTGKSTVLVKDTEVMASWCVSVHYTLLVERLPKACLLGQHLQLFQYEEKSWKPASKFDHHSVHITLSRGSLFIGQTSVGKQISALWGGEQPGSGGAALAWPSMAEQLSHGRAMSQRQSAVKTRNRPGVWSAGSAQVGCSAACCNHMGSQTSQRFLEEKNHIKKKAH